MRKSFSSYVSKINSAALLIDETPIRRLEDEIVLRLKNRRIFICGNGGSAANAIHMENDFLYGVRKSKAKVQMSMLFPLTLQC